MVSYSRDVSDNQSLINSSELEEIKKNIRFPSCRVIFSFMMCFGFVNVYMLRVNLSVALVAMVNSTFVRGKANATNAQECPGPNVSTLPDSLTSTSGEFDWDNATQGYILSSFFYGYILTQLIGGRLSEIFGGKHLFGFGILCTAILTIVSPFAARVSPYLFIAVRVLEGVGEGLTTPAAQNLIARWAPPLERSRMSTFIFSGCQLGMIITMPSTGIICEKLGWAWAFYIFGASGCIWFLFYTVLVYDSPNSHPRIDPLEKEYIARSLPTTETKSHLPWKDVLMSIPLWALVFTHFSYTWSFYTLITSLPKYLNDILHFDIKTNGFLSAFPSIAQYVVMLVAGVTADTWIKKGLLSVTSTRKIMNSIGLGSIAACLIAVSYLGCDHIIAVSLVVAGGGLAATSQAGYAINHIDLSPRYAGTLMGVTNTFATISGILGPQVVGWLTQNQPTLGQWQKIFFISSGINIFGLLVFCFLGSGELQPWSEPIPKLLDSSSPPGSIQRSKEDKNNRRTPVGFITEDSIGYI